MYNKTMQDKTARIIAIIALIFMAVFVSMLTATLATGKGILHDAFLYTTIGSGAVALLLFAVIKMSGRGYSITEMNNEIEMEKIRKENEEQIAKEQAEQSEQSEQAEKTETE